MTPIEHYWPPEMLAATFPDRFGHLAPERDPHAAARAVAWPRHDLFDRTTITADEKGTTIGFLCSGEAEGGHRRASEPAQVGGVTVERPYTVETVADGCDVIRPRFGRHRGKGRPGEPT